MPAYANRVTSTPPSLKTSTLRRQRPQGTAQGEAPLRRSPAPHHRRRERHQVVLQLLPGSEPFLIIKAPEREFKLPLSASLELVWSILETGTTKLRKRSGSVMVRVPLSDAVRIPPTS